MFTYLLVSYLLDLNVPTTALGHLTSNHRFKIVSHHFKKQVTKKIKNKIL